PLPARLPRRPPREPRARRHHYQGSTELPGRITPVSSRAPEAQALVTTPVPRPQPAVAKRRRPHKTHPRHPPLKPAPEQRDGAHSSSRYSKLIVVNVSIGCPFSRAGS